MADGIQHSQKKGNRNTQCQRMGTDSDGGGGGGG